MQGDEDAPDAEADGMDAEEGPMSVASDEKGDAAAEEHHGGGDQQWGEQPHRDLRWAEQSVGRVTRVVVERAPAGTRELERDGRHEHKAEEDVHRKEGGE